MELAKLACDAAPESIIVKKDAKWPSVQKEREREREFAKPESLHKSIHR